MVVNSKANAELGVPSLQQQLVWRFHVCQPQEMDHSRRLCHVGQQDMLFSWTPYTDEYSPPAQAMPYEYNTI